MKPFKFFLLALATWRIATMMVNEDGPWMAFEHLRLRAGLRPKPHPAGMRETDPPGQMPGSLFACVWCLSAWIGAAFGLLWQSHRKAAEFVAMPFALSAVACFLDWMTNWGDR